ncbi:hypothetical protein [Alkalihalobacterium alkalinitrilicum]|uniref:prenylated flavin chaperone LpdD n=1 Tax=Alkalihalobacterium alkalinitrilicum TaxID=427920 RepID=UPI0009956DE9|nr:hypothetical protein [Alkalihalobacterium alkalinitrilicum]
MIYYDVKKIEEDWLLAVYGGTRPHIGAVCIVKWQEGKANLLHSYQLPHHKEQEIAEEIALEWCSKFQRTVVQSPLLLVFTSLKQLQI